MSTKKEKCCGCPEEQDICRGECMCHHSQSESIEWEEKIRFAARLRPTTEEDAMRYADEAIEAVNKAITTAVAKREQEILEEAKKKISSAGGIGGWKHLEDILDEVILKH